MIQQQEQDIYYFHQGTHYNSYRFLGCHPIQTAETLEWHFLVWAPHASRVEAVGDFNGWNGADHPLRKLSNEGIWKGIFTDISPRQRYKYKIYTPDGRFLLKADPFARQSELRPGTASLTPDLEAYQWQDQQWQTEKEQANVYSSPVNIYEMHAGTWKKKPDGSFYSYRELAGELIPYVKELGYTHIELLPLSEHPFDLSWGYQITGYYSVTSRYGRPNDLKYFIDSCHRHQLGVIIDWVPSHFCKDDQGLRLFDGEPLYEYADPRKAEKRAWGTLTFDYGRPEVQSFLISNAVYWLEEYHIDGLRVDAVASMIFLNFDRHWEEEKIYNSFGTEENLEAIAFLKKLNETVFRYYPHSLMIAEDSSDYPLVTAPVHSGGLGFNLKWNMGWMNDMLAYMEHDPVYRKWHHHLLTFSFMYTFSENFVLPLSHDEVVHGKKSLLDKMPGDQWKKFSNLRLLYGYMMTHPGKKMLFMGGEFGQYHEWKDKEQLDWHLLDYPLHRSLFGYVRMLNHFYLNHPSLFEADHDPAGFEWIDPHNIDQSTIAFLRKDKQNKDVLIVICNFTPVVTYDYKVGVPVPGKYVEIFNSDAKEFGGSGQTNEGAHFTFAEKWHRHDQHIKVKIPPLAVSIFQQVEKEKKSGTTDALQKQIDCTC
ncbi:1,4-alpha-glucan branching enzyme [Evansella caseinilytica]|uniref:1,4-alpha-glucan branching enzyme GlgB n=1 Tax=Evansella caseinilytica TaxID=1503961 RepID=A0A1H3PFF1_9BACI|nr:1,4-alpha-glucan branching protein GlgB [Evansella caseinilytica]SDY99826.1 1,4-alpha-glucan branching enzyme [Evansella caseinilytica]